MPHGHEAFDVAFTGCSHVAMTRKDALEYRRLKRAEMARQIQHDKDEPLLELLRQLRPYTFGAELHDDPRALAMRKLHAAIDDVAEAVTGDREYFFAKSSSIG